MNKLTARALLTTGFVCLAVVLLVCWFLWTRPPQMGEDTEVFKAVDALFTAVTARDEKLLAQCAQRLRAYQEAGTLPDEAGAYLDAIIQSAAAGRWKPAAQRLYEFMRAQHRAGAVEHARRPQKNHPEPHPEHSK